MIRVEKHIVVDGQTLKLSAEGGSAKEALAIIEREADDLGAAPSGPNGVAPAAVASGKRARRTKAEMEAARAAAGAFQASDQSAQQPASAFDDSVPPMPEPEKSVTFAPPVETPPPPIADPLEPIREQIDQVVKATIAIKPEWNDAVIAAYRTVAGRFGGDIWKMDENQLQQVLTGVTGYRDRVKQAVGK
jgi:hypothetical protein